MDLLMKKDFECYIGVNIRKYEKGKTVINACKEEIETLLRHDVAEEVKEDGKKSKTPKESPDLKDIQDPKEKSKNPTNTDKPKEKPPKAPKEPKPKDGKKEKGGKK